MRFNNVFYPIKLKYISSNIVTIFNNHGDRDLNQRILRKLGYSEYFKAINDDFHHNNRHYVIINMSAEIESVSMRLCTNVFNESLPFIMFY